MTTKSYNGHKNYAQWNQSLWINNDQGLYNLAQECIGNSDSRTEAVEMFFGVVTAPDTDSISTPDGVKWSKAGIRAAMVGM